MVQSTHFPRRDHSFAGLETGRQMGMGEAKMRCDIPKLLIANSLACIAGAAL